MITFTIRDSKITATFAYDKKFVADMNKFRGAEFNGSAWTMPASDFNIQRMNALKDMYESRGKNLVTINQA